VLRGWVFATNSVHISLLPFLLTAIVQTKCYVVSHQASLDHPLMLPFTITILCERDQQRDWGYYAAPGSIDQETSDDQQRRPNSRPVSAHDSFARPLVEPFRNSVAQLSTSLPFVRPHLPPGGWAALLDVTTVVPAQTGMSKCGLRTSIGTLEGSACVIDARGA